MILVAQAQTLNHKQALLVLKTFASTVLVFQVHPPLSRVRLLIKFIPEAVHLNDFQYKSKGFLNLR